MTLKDIAREANVSVSTVSRILNGKSTGRNMDTYNLVWSIVTRENYLPNKYAQALRKNKATPLRQSPLVISSLLARTFIDKDDPFFSQLARSIDEQAYQLNYMVKHIYMEKEFSNIETIQNLSDEQSRGIIIMGRCEASVLKAMKRNFKYVCYTGLNFLDAKYDQIICNAVKASEAAVDYLIGLGHTKIAYIGEVKNEMRFQGYCNALNRAGIIIDNELIADVMLSLEGGAQGAKKLLDRRAQMTAIFCANDMTAAGAIRALKNANKKIPKEISVIGIDDIPMANYLSPPLTTVHVPIAEMGQMAMKTLVARINKEHELPMRIELPFFIVERESCDIPFS